MDKITAEELFDLFHTMGNEAEKEWHSIENGGLERADKARKGRHELLSYLIDELENPQLLCEIKHTISVRTEYMELTEKWYRTGNREMVEFALERIQELGEELTELIGKARKEPLEIET